ncbi:hypothetical protein TVAG_000530 [Trichomonas vaginalis G3]|uniref:RING finger protein 17 n=1 Tax=Trichomonas vaginalis (strain ATCC PRA-98 / G3) TaxID=412133 RepID=A2EHS9_TRIV3|nr:gamete generation protein family [Trichomonas vaginalis G3]EAY07769.1 hypothetical protein TVAG_000530 [Trichomonas vaginalis G3]KAI5542956.1 gamete generation protein family [Trichomonas vaginalis G3]|eukprot:XP_001319992.1 hypothetical protein [Trichomonas vaginalis G3]
MNNQGFLGVNSDQAKSDATKSVNIGKDVDAGTLGNLNKIAKSNEIKDPHPLSDKELAENAQLRITLLGISMESFLFICVNENGVKFPVELAGIAHTNITSSSPIIRNLFIDFFVENLLDKQFLLRIHTKSPNGYVGTLTQGNRDIGATMLIKGIVRFNSLTSNYLSKPNHFQALETTAKRQGTGIWADTNYKEIRTKPFPAQILAIPSSNTFTIINESGDEELFYLSTVHCPDFSFNGISEPFGFEAWNFIRETVIGKEVYITLDDDRADKKFATIKIGNEILNEMLCRKGLALLSINRVRKNSDYIEQIRNAYLYAQENQIGIFGSEIPKPVLVKELNREDRDLLMADEYSRNVRAIIVEVTGSVYLKLFVPSLQTILRVSLVGLVPLQSNDWTSRRAMEVLRRCFLHHEVDVTITRYAEHSRYYRVLIYDSISKLDARVPPVHEGLVHYNKLATDDPSTNKDELEQHAEEARSKSIGIFKSEGRNSSQIPKDKAIPVIITKVIDETTYAVQAQNDNSTKVNELLKADFPQLELLPMEDQYVIMVRNGVNYRAQVVRNRGPEVFVNLIDYGVDVWSFVSDLRKYDDELMQYQPNGFVVSLAFIQPFRNRSKQFTETCLNYIANIFALGNSVYIRRPFDRELPCVMMMMNDTPAAMTLQYALVHDGICTVIDEDVHQLFLPVVKELRKVMANAKENKFGGWSLQESLI